MEIIKELRHVQRMTEENLYKSRQNVLKEQEMRRRLVLDRNKPVFYKAGRFLLGI